MLRVKAYLIVQRNATRDYLGTAALVDRLGEEPAAAVLARIDDYYADRSNEEDSVLTSLVLRLAEPAPKDPKVTRQLRSYKELDRRWHDWASVVAVCTDVADRLLDLVEQEQRLSGPGLRRVRHVEVDPAAPVSTWPYEALVAILERGRSGTGRFLRTSSGATPGVPSPARWRTISTSRKSSARRA
jgi:hypothetical protein